MPQINTQRTHPQYRRVATAGVGSLREYHVWAEQYAPAQPVITYNRLSVEVNR